jgi:Zn ribbon nucleic-acid-binding protein
MKNRRDYSAPRQFKVGTTFARCRQCGGKEFLRLMVGDSMRCVACGHEDTYAALLRQIVKSAGERAAKAIKHAKDYAPLNRKRLA